MQSIEEKIESWFLNLKNENAFTESDAYELKDHLHDLMEELTGIGLDEEEAFIIASRRIGNVDEFEAEYRQENMEILQTRRTAIILSGVLLYFFSFHLFGSFLKLIFVILLKLDVSGWKALFWMNKFLITIHFLFIILFTSILLSEKKVLSFFEKIKISPKQAIFSLVAALILGISNVSLMAIAKSVIGDDLGLRGWFLHSFIYYQYTFPLLFCLGFILIYSKYYKKAKI